MCGRVGSWVGTSARNLGPCRQAEPQVSIPPYQKIGLQKPGLGNPSAPGLKDYRLIRGKEKGSAEGGSVLQVRSDF